MFEHQRRTTTSLKASITGMMISTTFQSMFPLVRGLRSPALRFQRDVARSVRTSVEPGNKERLATIRLYRLLQRAVVSFAAVNPSDPILLQPPIEATHWGRHMMFRLPDSSEVTNAEELFRLFHFWNDDTNEWYFSVVGESGHRVPPLLSETCWTTAENLKNAIRTFKTDYDGANSTTLTRLAIRALQILEEQKAMWSHSSCQTTEQIRVTATSRCIGTSDPTSHFPPAAFSTGLQSKHRFAYRIRIENLSDQYVQLLGRHWHISEEEGGNDPVVVDAPGTGAVGQLPVLRPNQVFEYISGTDLAKSKGEMKGHFYMMKVSEDAISLNSGDEVDIPQDTEYFEAVVAPFPLLAA
eukprot:scaffold16189_cov125-Cylindrotheca_fusiformis.AAC.11